MAFFEIHVKSVVDCGFMFNSGFSENVLRRRNQSPSSTRILFVFELVILGHFIL
jgi:hypothetical protein